MQELIHNHRPEKPLKWLAEFLGQRSREVEGERERGGEVKGDGLGI